MAKILQLSNKKIKKVVEIKNKKEEKTIYNFFHNLYHLLLLVTF